MGVMGLSEPGREPPPRRREDTQAGAARKRPAPLTAAFSDHYTRTATEADSWQERLVAERESSDVRARDGTPIAAAIQDAAGIDEEPAADALEILEERHWFCPDKDKLGEELAFDPDSCHEEKGPNDQAWHEEWRSFENALKT